MVKSGEKMPRSKIGVLKLTLLAAAVCALLLLSAFAWELKGRAVDFVTWDGLEPDKWASVWLIKRHIDADAEILLRPIGAPTDEGIAFGVPDARYKRSHGISVYESLRSGFGVHDPRLLEISHIISDIEISPWSGSQSAHSATVERAFRDLQNSYDAREVPIDCYGRFFDEVYTLIEAAAAESEWDRLHGIAGSAPECRSAGSEMARRDAGPFVRRLESTVTLDHIAADKNVVFVDVREPSEFEEFHIPGAINLQLRDVGPELAEVFADADLVIPYCIKDFRGFEMARSLAELGVRNVGIMKPYGIAGWRRVGLPVAERGGLSDAEALDRLRECARAGTCLATST
jgi:rhodanese-related sulfurtransferase